MTAEEVVQEAYAACRPQHQGMAPADVIRSLYARLDRLRDYSVTIRREAGRSDIPEDIALLLRQVAALCS